MKDGPGHIFGPAAEVSLTTLDRALPWPTPLEEPSTGHCEAQTGSRTTSAPRRNSAHPVDKKGR